VNAHSRLALAVAAATLGSAVPAGASEVTSARSFRPEFFGEPVGRGGDNVVPSTTTYSLAVAAGSGEVNAVAVELTAEGFVVRDAAGVTAGDGCAVADATTVTCSTSPEPGTTRVERGVASVTLGDGDDSIVLPPRSSGFFSLSEVDGGSGDDTIAGAGRATGGPGDDRLDAVVADGGPGNDLITARDADGGDGGDTISPNEPGVPVKLRGGAGNDVLTGGFNDPLKSSMGTGDVLDGGEGADRLDAGAGDDRLLPGPGADVIVGGPGLDFVSFAYASAPVRADLAAAGPVDPTGEGDAMTAVESAEGGSGDDVLLATNDDSVLLGNAGNDRLEGRGGPDIIIGGVGADVIDGEDGDDDITAGTALPDFERGESGQHESDAAADRVTGGAGKDVVRVGSGDRADGGSGDDLIVGQGRPAAARCGTGTRDRFDGRTLPRDCERIVWFGFVSAPAQTTLRRGTLSIRAPGHFGGRVTVSVRVDGRRVAAGSRRIGSFASKVVRLPVTPRGQRALRRARSVRVDILAPGPDDDRRERDTAVLPAPR